MATVGDWSEIELCNVADVNDRWERVGDLTGASDSGLQSSKIDAIIAKAKEHIGRQLDVQLRHRHWEMDLTDTTLDIKDFIANPQVLKEAAVAWTLRLLFQQNSFAPDDMNISLKDDFEREFNREFGTALDLLQLDKDRSGAIEDIEVSQSPARYRFHRS